MVIELVCLNFYDKKFEREYINECVRLTDRKYFIFLYEFNLFRKLFKKKKFNLVEIRGDIKILRGWYSIDEKISKLRNFRWFPSLYISEDRSKLVNAAAFSVCDFILPLFYSYYQFYKFLREYKISIIFPAIFFFESIKNGKYKYADVIYNNSKLVRHYSLNYLICSGVFLGNKKKDFVFLKNEEILRFAEYLGLGYKKAERMSVFIFNEIFDRVYKMYVKKSIIFPGVEIINKIQNNDRKLS